MCKKHSAASQIYWLKKLVDLKMKEGTTMPTHLIKFNTIFSELTTQEVVFLDSVKAIFLLITLPNNWETIKIALSNLASFNGLTSANVVVSLVVKEVYRKNINKDKEEALVVHGRQGKEKRGKKVQSKSKSCNGRDKQSNDDIECYHYGKTSHMKRDCLMQKQQKCKGKASNFEDKKKGVKMEEVNLMHNNDESDGEKT